MTRALVVAALLAACGPPPTTCEAYADCPARGDDARAQRCCEGRVCTFEVSDGTSIGPYDGESADDTAEAEAAVDRYCDA